VARGRGFSKERILAHALLSDFERVSLGVPSEPATAEVTLEWMSETLVTVLMT
jgi:hypothetical protein